MQLQSLGSRWLLWLLPLSLLSNKKKMGKSKSLLLSNLIYLLAGLGLTETKGTEVGCICKDEN